jgi:hypothetical protein
MCAPREHDELTTAHVPSVHHESTRAIKEEEEEEA